MKKLARMVMHGGQPRSVIDDDVLLDWAASENKSPHAAQIEALTRGILPTRYLKNTTALFLEEQRRVCESRVFICGCGGLGGVLIHLLARAGVGFMRISDGDCFNPSNLNRQWFCLPGTVGLQKARTAAAGALAINPLIEVEPLELPLTAENAVTMLDGVDLVVDALDDIPARFHLARAARVAGIPFIHAAVAGWLGQIATFPPDAKAGLETVYGDQRSRSDAEESMGVHGTVVSAIASLQAMEAVRLLAGRPPAYAGRMFYFDGESGTAETLPLWEP